jgi:hypothetical protein
VVSDVGEPQSVRRLGAEPPLDEVVVHRRPGHPVPAALAGVRRPQPLGRAEPVHPVAARAEAMVGELVGGEPVANSGSSWWMSTAALIRRASSQSRWETGFAFHL